jgi:hypothetical protein
MGFETVVLSIVKDTVRHARAEFTNGTMFVDNINAVEANRIVNGLRGFVYADTIVSQIGNTNEFAFDFA